MDKSNDNKPVASQNEGEGSKTADKQYRDAATSFAKKGDALRQATQAEREVEANPREYADAEAAGRAHGPKDLKNDLTGDIKKEQ